MKSTLHIPGAKVARLDLDTHGPGNAYSKILEGFGAGKYDILVGTQMLVRKGSTLRTWLW